MDDLFELSIRKEFRNYINSIIRYFEYNNECTITNKEQFIEDTKNNFKDYFDEQIYNFIDGHAQIKINKERD